MQNNKKAPGNLAREFYSKALELDEKQQYLKAAEFFKKAEKEYLKLNDKQIMIAFKCSENAAKNLIRAMDLEFLVVDKNSTSSLIYDIVPENKIVNDFLLDLQFIRKQVHNSYVDISRMSIGKRFAMFFKKNLYVDPRALRISYACSTHLIKIYKDFENFLYNRGFTDEAIKIFYVMNREKTDKLYYMMKLTSSGSFDRIKYYSRWIGRKIWEVTLGFGVKPKRLFYTALNIVILWGMLFWLFNLVYYVGDQYFPASYFHCFYYSIVSITFIGSNFLEPMGFWGKALQSIETILGFIIFAATVAFFTKKIK